MLSIGIGELQKNIALFTKLQETFQIVDKRKKEVLAYVYPVKKNGIISSLAGKYKDKASSTKLSLEDIKKIAFEEAMEEKYGLSS